MSHVPSNKLGRRKHDWLIAHGYRLVGRRGGGHFEYECDDQPMYLVSDTSYDAQAWQAFKSEMRKRHPGVFRQRKSQRAKGPGRLARERVFVEWVAEHGLEISLTQAQQILGRCGSVSEAKRALLGKATVAKAPARRAPRESRYALRPECGDCGRPWLSDLDPTGRTCPGCGGTSIGTFLKEAA